MNDSLKEDTLAAISVVTAYMDEPGEDKPFTTRVADDWASEHPNGQHRLINGFLQLTMVLLAMHERNASIPAKDTLFSAADLINGWGLRG